MMNRSPTLQEFNQLPPLQVWEEAGRAACKDKEPSIWDTPGGNEELAKYICSSCEVREACFEMALSSNIRYGILGGTTPEERRTILRRRDSYNARAKKAS